MSITNKSTPMDVLFNGTIHDSVMLVKFVLFKWFLVNQKSIKNSFHHRVHLTKKCSPTEPCITTMITNKNSDLVLGFEPSWSRGHFICRTDLECLGLDTSNIVHHMVVLQSNLAAL